MLDPASVIRDARIEDAEAVQRAHAAAWRKAYAGLIPQEVIDQVTDPATAVEHFRRGLASSPPGTGMVVWDEPGSGPVGYATFGPGREPDPGWAGEVYAIYVHPDWQGGGRGRALLVEAGRRLDRPFLLWVLRENAAARGFYERLGGTLLGRDKVAERFGGIVEVAYGWASPPR